MPTQQRVPQFTHQSQYRQNQTIEDKKTESMLDALEAGIELDPELLLEETLPPPQDDMFELEDGSEDELELIDVFNFDDELKFDD